MLTFLLVVISQVKHKLTQFEKYGELLVDGEKTTHSPQTNTNIYSVNSIKSACYTNTTIGTDWCIHLV